MGPQTERKALVRALAREAAGFPRLGVGLSGGRDSTALLRLLASLEPKPDLTGLHLNHRLRPDSDRQAAFVRELAATLGVPLVEAEEEVIAREQSIEEAGRLARLDFFARAARQHRLDAVAVAHTRTDQAETLLLNLARGAGGLGLAAMPPLRTDPRGFRLWRPLLGVSRGELAVFADDCYPDPWNHDPRFARVRVRERVLPCLARELNPSAEQALARTAGLLRDDEGWLEATARARYRELAEDADAEGVRLPARQLAELHPALARRVLREALKRARGNLRRIEFVHVEAMMDLVRSPRRGATLDLPGVQVRMEERTLVLRARYNRT